MARATRGKKKKKSSIEWGVIGRWTLRTGAILMLVALAFGMVFGIDRLRSHAESQLMLVSAPAGGDTPVYAIDFAWPGLEGSPGQTWMIEEDADELRRVASRAVSEDAPLSVEPLRRISEELGKTGWYVGDPSVRRVGERRVLIEGEWRIPTAVVRWEGYDHLVSDQAMPMPPVYRAGTSSQPFIEGVFSGAVVRGEARYANSWPGPGVRVGLDLIAALRDANLLGVIAGIDVSGYLDGGPIEIVSADGNRVVWGSPVDEWQPGEPSVDEKIVRLVQLVERTGSVDAGQRRIEIHRARVEIDRTGSGTPNGLGNGND